MSSQNSVFPIREEVEADAPPATVALDEAADVVNALTSETARRILGRLCEEPATASELATAVGTTIQNVEYHVEQLQTAGLIASIDTWYSERGREMDVYAAQHEPLVIVAGDSDDRATVRRRLSKASPSAPDRPT